MNVAEGLKKGFTTGSCAAAAAKAAAYMLLSDTAKVIDEISIMTPAGTEYHTEITDITKGKDYVSCGVIKHSGDDPDVTDGICIYARVSMQSKPQGIEITGGTGIGIVTRPGLDRPVGDYAINSVPRRMIEKEVKAVALTAGYSGGLKVEISAPEGIALAGRTFNPRLGIEGGISIIGTSGIVEPMSTTALLDTIRLELKQRRELGYDYAVLTPGNYGRELMLKRFGYDIDRSVRCSNYIGESVDMAVGLGYDEVLLAGHIGKLIKVAGGIMNTHSREADCRMEILTGIAVIKGADADTCRDIMRCVSTEEALVIIDNAGLREAVMGEVTERITGYLRSRLRRTAGVIGERADAVSIDCIVYSNELGILGMSEGIKQWEKRLSKER